MATRSITTPELARASGLGERTLRNYIAGRRQPDGAELVRLAKALRVPPSRINPQAKILQVDVPTRLPMTVVPADARADQALDAQDPTP